MNEAAMSQEHSYILNLGSNLDPEHHLLEAIERLRAHGIVEEK